MMGRHRRVLTRVRSIVLVEFVVGLRGYLPRRLDPSDARLMEAGACRAIREADPLRRGSVGVRHRHHEHRSRQQPSHTTAVLPPSGQASRGPSPGTDRCDLLACPLPSSSDLLSASIAPAKSSTRNRAIPSVFKTSGFGFRKPAICLSREFNGSLRIPHCRISARDENPCNRILRICNRQIPLSLAIRVRLGKKFY